MAYLLADHARLARDAWERGHSILLHVANGILAENGIDLVVDAPRDETPSDIVGELDDCGRELIRHLRPLEPYMQEGILIDDLRPWRLGIMFPMGYTITDAFIEAIKDNLTTADDDPKGWQEQFVEPMLNHAKDWRERFDLLQRQFAAPPRPTNMQECIIEALGAATLTAQEIADRSGYKNTSRFRQTLSNMVKGGQLVKATTGYGYSVPR